MTSLLGVALAGGHSRRLGVDKRTLLIERQGRTLTLVDWTLVRLAAVCDEVVVATGEVEARSEPGDPQHGAGARRVPDAPSPAAGPAAGLLGAALSHPGCALLALACDLPRVPVALVERLASEHRDHPEAAWIVPVRGGRLEPLCAVYAPEALRTLARRAVEGRNALHELASIESLQRRELEIDQLDELVGVVEPLLNLNTAEDLERFRGFENRRV
ncbi:MAG TPA: molybdenum cofactor guanylyltransferase [Thermoanaerobaculia bacterium]|nr:molybdenum cofactor guanylyltransferase [Thermoanaerobaculia bacterium]